MCWAVSLANYSFGATRSKNRLDWLATTMYLLSNVSYSIAVLTPAEAVSQDGICLNVERSNAE